MDDKKETQWISMLKDDVLSVPENESDFIEEIIPTIERNKLILSEYGL